MDDARRKNDLEKRVKVFRAMMGSDYLGATFIELACRIDEAEDDWIEASAYSFYMSMLNINPEKVDAFNRGLAAALSEIEKEYGNGESS